MSDKPQPANDSMIFDMVKEDSTFDDIFESSVKEFTDYYRIQGQYDVQERLVSMYVAKRGDKVVGYVTLAMAHLKHDATDEIRAKEINGNIPALLISHLAVHKNFCQQRIGTRLLNLAFHVMRKMERRIGCRYAMLNPRDDQGVRDFYANYGFKYYLDINDDKKRDAFLMDLKRTDLGHMTDPAGGSHPGPRDISGGRTRPVTATHG